MINGVFAFVQEFRAERAAEDLNDLLPKRSVVIGDGERREIAASGLVPGDLVILRAGDLISVDLEVVHSDALTVDTSTLTGESTPSAVEDASDLFAGCFVISGEGRATARATGAGTRLASIADSPSNPGGLEGPVRHR